jgi:hypothetical protein
MHAGSTSHLPLPDAAAAGLLGSTESQLDQLKAILPVDVVGQGLAPALPVTLPPQLIDMHMDALSRASPVSSFEDPIAVRTAAVPESTDSPDSKEKTGMRLLPALACAGVGLAARFLVPIPQGVTPQAWTLLAVFLSTIAGRQMRPLHVIWHCSQSMPYFCADMMDAWPGVHGGKVGIVLLDYSLFLRLFLCEQAADIKLNPPLHTRTHAHS